VDEKRIHAVSKAIASNAGCGRAFRTALRLIAGNDGVTIGAVPSGPLASVHQTVQTAVHRFQETIGGRVYEIEAAPIAPHRWRAYIARVPGVPTALMPFYGPTPDQAAANLREWLTRAHAKASAASKAAAHV
jgi:hypothetical protein